MDSTSLTLLGRLKNAGSDGADWKRFHDLYLPFVRAFLLSRIRGLGSEVEDLAQNVFSVVVRELPNFERQNQGHLRNWLRVIMGYRILAFVKTRQKQPLAGLGDGVEQQIAQLKDPTSDLSQQWDSDHEQHILPRLFALVRPDFEPKTWQAFQQVALQGQPAAAVAAELEMTVTAVRQAKSRVLKRLREEAKIFGVGNCN